LFRQVVAILEAGQPLPYKFEAAKLDLPELQVREQTYVPMVALQNSHSVSFLLFAGRT
jgi:hypothetical protein